MWLYFLNGWNGISMFHNVSSTTTEDLHLYTDASRSIGFGGFFQGQWFSSAWPDTFKALLIKDNEISIAFCELYPIVVAAVLWGHTWAKKRIIFMCDNTATVAILQKGRSKSSHIMPLVRQLTMCAASHNFTFRGKHVPGNINTIADALSRLQIPKFRTLAPTASPTPCVVPPPTENLWTSKPN